MSRAESGWSTERPSTHFIPTIRNPNQPSIVHRCAQPTFSCSRARLSPTLRWEIPSAGWRRRPPLVTPRNAVSHLAVKPQVPGIETNHLHDKAHLSLAPALARARDAGSRVLLSRRADRGDERCRHSGSERQAGRGRSARGFRRHREGRCVDPARSTSLTPLQAQTFSGNQFAPSMTALTSMCRCLPE
jgi:hypothetical protein